MENENTFQIGKYQCMQILLHTTQDDNYKSYKNHFYSNNLNPLFELEPYEYIYFDECENRFKSYDIVNQWKLTIKTCINTHLTTFCTESTITPMDKFEEMFFVYEELIKRHCVSHLSYLQNVEKNIQMNKENLIEHAIQTFKEKYGND